MAKLHSATPREITSPFTREIISVLHSKACNNYTNSIPRKLPIGNSTGYFTRYIEIVREICNSTARVK